MASRSAVVAGEALVDLLVRPDGAIAPAPGGGPFNTARTIGRLGGRAAFLGRLSTDRFGRLLERMLARDGVDLALAVPTDDPTTLALAEIDQRGSATYRFYLAGTSAPGLTRADLPAGTLALHVGTLGLVLEPIGSTLERLVADAPPGVLVMLDVNARSIPGTDAEAWRARIRRIAGRADVVKASREDLQSLGESAEDLRGRGPAVVIVTDGPNLVEVHAGSGRLTVRPPSVQVVDSVGAGDAFGGGWLAWWLERGLGRRDLADRAPVRAAAAFAAEVAAITCTRAGADPPARAELRRGVPPG